MKIPFIAVLAAMFVMALGFSPPASASQSNKYELFNPTDPLAIVSDTGQLLPALLAIGGSALASASLAGKIPSTSNTTSIDTTNFRVASWNTPRPYPRE